jgi:Tol biopolymer transport system component
MEDGKPTGLPFRVKPDIGNYDNIGVTAAGLFYYVQRHPNLEQVVLAEFDLTAIQSGTPKVLQRFPGRLPSWSPDGRLLALARGPRTGATGQHIVVHAIDAGDERVFPVSEIPDRRAIWLPDSSGFVQILSPSAARTERVWQRLDLKRATFETMPGLPNPMFFNVPQLAADGRTLYLLGGPINANGEFDQILAFDISTNRQRAVFTLPSHRGSATGPALSPDGRTLAFSWRPPDTDAWRFATVATDGTQFRDLRTTAARPPHELVWMKDGRSLLFNAGDGRNGCRLMRLSLEEDRAESTSLNAQSLIGQCVGTFVLSPDGRRIAYQSVENANELWAINVSAAALAKKQR